MQHIWTNTNESCNTCRHTTYTTRLCTCVAATLTPIWTNHATHIQLWMNHATHILWFPRHTTYIMLYMSCVLGIIVYVWHGSFIVVYVLHDSSILVYAILYMCSRPLGDKVIGCLPDLSTFASYDRLQHLFYVLPIMWCAFGAHLDVGLAERLAPCRFIETVHVSFPRSREDGRLW